MDGVTGTPVAHSVDALNQILAMASSKQMEMAEKLVKVGLEMGVAAGKSLETGKVLDVLA